jgi:hypothetical protein
MNRNTIATVTLLSTALVACAGCSSVKSGHGKLSRTFDVRRVMWWKDHKPEPQAPVRLVSSWTDTVLYSQGQKSQRGFGGRLSFFGRDSEDPVRVDGQLVVYAYDESKGDPRNVQPTRRYIFPREQFSRLQSDSALGPSYSVWLPWDDDLAGPQKSISLIARFEPHGGPLLVGEQTRHLLPGTALADDAPAPTSSPNGIQLAQHTTPAQPEPEPQGATPLTETGVKPHPELSTTSIHLSEHWRDRLATPTTVESFRQHYEAASTEPTRTPQGLFPQGSQTTRRRDRPSTGFPPGTHPVAERSSVQ